MHLPTTLTPELLAAFRDEVQKLASMPTAAAADVAHAMPGLTAALPYMATAAGGALAFDQAGKAYDDWKIGRQQRIQQAMYR